MNSSARTSRDLFQERKIVLFFNSRGRWKALKVLRIFYIYLLSFSLFSGATPWFHDGEDDIAARRSA